MLPYSASSMAKGGSSSLSTMAGGGGESGGYRRNSVGVSLWLHPFWISQRAIVREFFSEVRTGSSSFTLCDALRIARVDLASGPIKVLVPTRIGVILGRRKEFRHETGLRDDR
jgi:hypothetical protein